MFIAFYYFYLYLYFFLPLFRITHTMHYLGYARHVAGPSSGRLLVRPPFLSFFLQEIDATFFPGFQIIKMCEVLSVYAGLTKNESAILS